MAEPQQEYVFELRGGDLALDFVNTVERMRGAAAKERLAGYADLVAFAEHAGAVPSDEAAVLRDAARRHPEAAAAALVRATALREPLYRAFVAAIEGTPPAPEDLAPLNDCLRGAFAHRRLAPGPDGRLALAWDARGDLDEIAWRVADAAAALLTSDDLARVRMCCGRESNECSWLFVDRTKGRTRRWCSMEDCGNRAKARRHYARHKAKDA